MTSNGALTKRFLRKDGTPVWVSVHVALVRDTEGQPLHFTTLIEDLTDRKRAEEALRHSEEWLRFAQDAAGVGIWDWDAATGETRASEQQFRLYGLDPATKFPPHEEFLRLIHPGDRDRMARELDSAMSGKSLYESQFRVVWPDASVHWLFAQGRAFLSETGEPARFVGANVDITEHVRTQSTVKEFFDLSPAPLAIIGFDGHIRQANQALLSATGLTIEELQQSPFVDFFHPEDRAAIAREFSTVVATGESAEFEARGVTGDGSIRWLLLTFGAVEDEKLVYVTAHDITERKLAEEALGEREAQFRELFDSAPVAYHELDTEGVVRRVNRAECAMLGYQAGEMLGRPIWEFIAGAEREASREALRRKLSGEQPLTPYERCYLRRDGDELWVEIHDSLVRNAAGETTGIRTALLNITERRRMEEEIRVHSEKLVRSNAELERFAYVASHDLQEPLRMVASFTQLLGKRYSGRLDETADRYIHYAVDGAKRMQELIADLLAYSRVNSKELDLRRTECETVVRGAMENLQVAIEESAASIDCDPLPALSVDRAQLAQLFQNLLGNAIKFRRNEERLRIHISAVDNGAEWAFSVQDNGIGIDPRHADRIFQIFQRLHTRSEYPGTGIGLAVCKKVVERHGGRIWVESQPGTGSNFRFTLPKAETEEAADGWTE